MKLMWRHSNETHSVQNSVVVWRICYEQDHYKIAMNFEIDRNIVSVTGTNTEKRFHHMKL